MATRSRALQRKPHLTTVQLLNESESKPNTSTESSVDLFIVFDDNVDRSSAGRTSSRVIDEAEESPREKERNYYKILFESTVDGVLLIDAETMRIVLANETAAEMYGFDSAEDMIGVNPLKFVHADDRDRVLRIIVQDVIHNNLRQIHKFRAVARDGTELWLRAVGTRTEYRGRLAGLISIRDISDRKRVEEERQRTEQRLQFASRLASLGELAAGVAHELNDPLAAVLAYGQLLMSRENLDEITRSGLEAIYREAQRTATIADNLLLLARRHKPEKSLVSINRVLERALDLCAHQMEANNIAVFAALEPDLPMTMADSHQMQQVFVNIINNAQQAIAGSRSQGTLHVTTQKVGELLRITFADNGEGISEDNLPRIFDPFFTTKGSGKGTGLGLTVSCGLVEVHGGHMYAESKLGEGTTLVVEIPIAATDQPVNGQADLIQAKWA